MSFENQQTKTSSQTKDTWLTEYSILYLLKYHIFLTKNYLGIQCSQKYYGEAQYEAK